MLKKIFVQGKFLFQIKESFPVPIKDKQDLQHSSCQNENISFAIYVYSWKGYIFEKENKFVF